MNNFIVFICCCLIFFAYAFTNGAKILLFSACIMLFLFCLNANSKHNINIAPTPRDNKVAVTPEARYLLSTIITNNAGANALIPIIKLLINNIMAVGLSRNK